MNNEQKTSIWFDAVSDSGRFPELTGDVSTDVVIVGGGIAGVMTAWQLARKGTRVVLLERNTIASGDTGFTTAFMTRVPDVESLAKLSDKYHVPFMKRIFAITRQAQDELKKIITEEQIDCDFKELDSYMCSYGGTGDEFLKKEWEIVKQVDTDAELVQGLQVPDWKGGAISQAIKFKHEARFHVRKFLFGLLARPTAKQQIQIFEQSEVTQVKVGEQVVVRTAHGRVIAKKIVVASGLPIDAFRELQTPLEQSVSFAFAAHCPDGVPFSDDLFWDTDNPYQYYRRFDDHTIILGGADESTQSLPKQPNQSEPKKLRGHDFLRHFFETRFPQTRYNVTHSWSGVLFESSDGLPYATAHPHVPGKVFVITGLSGNGMVMGTMCAMIAADLASGAANQSAPLFSFLRTKTVIAQPVQSQVQETPRANEKAAHANSQYGSLMLFWKIVLPILFLVILPMPAIVFFMARGGTGFLQGVSFQDANTLLFPLVGLYAYTFVWAQLMLGSNMNFLRRVYPWLEPFHHIEGLAALIFATIHPSMRYLGLGLTPIQYLTTQTVATGKVIFLWIGYFQLTLMFATVGAALLRKQSWMKKWWRTVHYGNYVLFVLIWIHSWYIGSDVRVSSLKYLWIFFGITGGASIIARIARNFIKPRVTTSAMPGDSASQQTPEKFVRVASVGDVMIGTPMCVEIGEQKLALFKVGDSYYALDNKCSHAGGPLCEGKLDGEVIECPWHGSQFNIKSGAVLASPAKNPMRVFPVRVTGNDIEVGV